MGTDTGLGKKMIFGISLKEVRQYGIRMPHSSLLASSHIWASEASLARLTSLAQIGELARRLPSFQTLILATYLTKGSTVTYHVCNGLLILLHNNPEGNQRVLISNLVHKKHHEFLCSWKFFPNSASSHWFLRGHMTSNNETVSRQNL